MPNTIQLAKTYTNLLDEVYQQSSLTAVLDSDATLSRAGANANEIVIPKLSMDGLADYDRNSGYTNGNVDLSWETVKFNYERGRSFQVDNMDNEETQNIAFGRLAGEFIRTKVVPELDAFRLSTYAGIPNVGNVTGSLATGEAVIGALRTATSEMDEAEVPMEDRHLFITPTLLGLVQDLDTTKSKEVLSRFATITKVPQTRFYSLIELLDGKSPSEEKGGFKKASGGVELNFEIIHKPAVLQFTKHAVPKIISPEANQDADAWKYGYRNYGLCDVYDNKVAGIYVHKKA